MQPFENIKRENETSNIRVAFVRLSQVVNSFGLTKINPEQVGNELKHLKLQKYLIFVELTFDKMEGQFVAISLPLEHLACEGFILVQEKWSFLFFALGRVN